MSSASVHHKTLIYVVDPMCSWCWGFSPVFDDLIQSYQDQVPIHIMMGGLRPGNTERFDEPRRSYILGHWRAVHARTGQPFNFEFQMGPTFIYDTEPASRAMIVMRNLDPSRERAYLRAIQESFYVTNADVTKEDILADLASNLGLDRMVFLEHYRDQRHRHSVWAEFDQARQLGVNGFPTLLGQEADNVIILTHGYRPFQELKPAIDRWLNVPVPA